MAGSATWRGDACVTRSCVARSGVDGLTGVGATVGNAEYALNPSPVGRAGLLNRGAGERAEELRKAHELLKRLGPIIAVADAEAVQHVIPAGVDSARPRPLAEATEMGPVRASNCCAPGGRT